MSAPNSKPPSDAMMELLAPDGYYKYLQISKPSGIPDAKSADAFDADAVKKAYRKLSRKHHPDKPGGDADTFRLLNRANKVLTTQKLREQYDILGIDLDDDEHHETDGDDKHDDKDQEGGPPSSGAAQGIVHEIANMILTGIVQLGVRTREF